MMQSRVGPGGRWRSLAAVTVIVCAGVAGCAGLGINWPHYGPGPLKVGDTEAAVLARLGTPHERVTRPGGQRLVFVRGPMGKHTWMVELGADGRVQSLEQVLEPARFAKVQPGMSQAQVRELLGPPAERRRLAIEGRSLEAWRFQTYDCLLFAVTLNNIGRVLDAGYMPDPVCDVDTE